MLQNGLLLHWYAGFVPEVVQPAPLVFIVSEPAGSVNPPVIYPGPLSLPQVAFGQYCLNTALLPAPVRLLTVTFQPELVPLLVICMALPQMVSVDCDWPLSVTPVRVGSLGAVVKATVVANEEAAVSVSVAITTAHPSARRWMPVRVTTFGAVDMAGRS